MGYNIEGKKMKVQEGKLDTWTTWKSDNYKRNRKGSIVLEEGSDDYNEVVMLRVITEEGDIGEPKIGSDAVLYLEDIEHLIDGLEKMRKNMILSKADQERNYRLTKEEQDDETN